MFGGTPKEGTIATHFGNNAELHFPRILLSRSLSEKTVVLQLLVLGLDIPAKLHFGDPLVLECADELASDLCRHGCLADSDDLVLELATTSAELSCHGLVIIPCLVTVD